MKPQFKIIFFLYRSKINRKGKAPIYTRITKAKKQKHFSTGFFISPDSWDSQHTSVLESSPLHEQINNYLDVIRSKALDIALKSRLNEKEISLDALVNELLGKKAAQLKSFLEVFRKHNEEVKSLIGKSYSPATLKKFESIYRQVEEFIKIQYQQDDILLSNLNLKFLLDLEYYLLAKKDLKQISINKILQRVKKITKYAVAHEYLEKDPFPLHKAKPVNLDVVFLDQAELQKLEEFSFEKEKHCNVRDCFIFCCYTGLAYQEMATLSSKHIIKGFDDKDWVKIQRLKTGKTIEIPLLPKAVAILQEYNNNNYYYVDGILLPVISNQRFNTYLKEIAELVGIKKKLTHHVARKTFASTVLLYNDVPMEVVSELLGHSSMDITQRHYGKVVNKKLSEQMEKLGKKLDDKNKK